MPGLYTLCFVISEGRVLLQRRTNPPYQGKWNAPGGKVEPLEAPHEACVREVEEETGLRVRNPRLRAVVTIGSTTSNGEDSATLFVFYSERFTGTLRSSVEGAVEWLSLSTLEHNPDVVEDLVRLLPYIDTQDSRPVSGKLIYEHGRISSYDFRFA